MNSCSLEEMSEGKNDVQKRLQGMVPRRGAGECLLHAAARCGDVVSGLEPISGKLYEPIVVWGLIMKGSRTVLVGPGHSSQCERSCWLDAAP